MGSKLKGEEGEEDFCHDEWWMDGGGYGKNYASVKSWAEIPGKRTGEKSALGEDHWIGNEKQNTDCEMKWSEGHNAHNPHSAMDGWMGKEMEERKCDKKSWLSKFGATEGRYEWRWQEDGISLFLIT
jgi:hypothetical protein